MKDALKAIADFSDKDAMFDYCRKNNIKFQEAEPPHLTMAKIAAETLRNHGQDCNLGQESELKSTPQDLAKKQQEVITIPFQY